MTQGRKTGGRDFKKGNPGRAPVPAEVKAARKLSQNELTLLLNKYLYQSRAQLQRIAKRKSTPMIDLFVISIISKGTSGGDHKRLEFLFDRLVGRVPLKARIDGNLTHNAHEGLLELLHGDPDSK